MNEIETFQRFAYVVSQDLVSDKVGHVASDRVLAGDGEVVRDVVDVVAADSQRVGQVELCAVRMGDSCLPGAGHEGVEGQRGRGIVRPSEEVI